MRKRTFGHGACVLLAVFYVGAGSPSTAAQPRLLPPSADRGADIYETKCGACHSLDANRIGPKHRGVVGRKAGSVPDFTYLPALKKLGIIWTPQNLNKWLQNPTAMAPGTAMGFQLPSAQERADVIAYLEQQK